MPQTLLLADDSVTIQRVIELTFAGEDIKVVAVGDGRQAIEQITADPPDIVLADTGMPERDGYDVAAFIKGDPSLEHIPVVLLTGAFEPVDGDRARKVGCDAVLVKPFEPQVVITRVRELLRLPPSAEPAGGGIVTGPGEPPAGAGLQVPSPSSAGHAERFAEMDLGSTVPAPAPLTLESETAPSTPGGSASDPLAEYLDRLDEAFDQVQRPDPPASPEPPATQDAWPVAKSESGSLDGALSALEGALETLTLDELDEKLDRAGAGGETAGAAPSGPNVGDAEEEAPAPAAVPEGDSEEEAQVGATVSSWPPPPVEATGASSASGPEDESPDPLPVAPDAPVFEMPSEPDPVGGGAWPAAVTEPERDEPAAVAPEPSAPAPFVAASSASEPKVRSGVGLATPQPAPRAASPPVAPTPPATPTLAHAFASLLAAEQGDLEQIRPAYPWAGPAADAPGLEDELVERVTERVISRLSEGVTGELVAEVVAQVAERLVREEIERIKQD